MQLVECEGSGECFLEPIFEDLQKGANDEDMPGDDEGLWATTLAMLGIEPDAVTSETRRYNAAAAFANSMLTPAPVVPACAAMLFEELASASAAPYVNPVEQTKVKPLRKRRKRKPVKTTSKKATFKKGKFPFKVVASAWCDR